MNHPCHPYHPYHPCHPYHAPFRMDPGSGQPEAALQVMATQLASLLQVWFLASNMFFFGAVGEMWAQVFLVFFDGLFKLFFLGGVPQWGAQNGCLFDLKLDVRRFETN